MKVDTYRFNLTFAILALSAAWFFTVLASASGQPGDLKRDLVSPEERNILRRLTNWSYTTPSYRAMALRLMIGEANQVAKELALPEALPIKESNLVEALPVPPALEFLGEIATTNYAYYFGLGRTL